MAGIAGGLGRMWARAGQVPQERMSREEQEWASSKCPTEGSVLPCGKIRCAFFKAHNCYEWEVDGSGFSVKEAKRDKETEPELSHTIGGRTVNE